MVAQIRPVLEALCRKCRQPFSSNNPRDEVCRPCFLLKRREPEDVEQGLKMFNPAHLSDEVAVLYYNAVALQAEGSLAAAVDTLNQVYILVRAEKTDRNKGRSARWEARQASRRIEDQTLRNTMKGATGKSGQQWGGGSSRKARQTAKKRARRERAA